MRYTAQEMNNSGFIYYAIIDTENACKIVYTTKDYWEMEERLERWNDNHKKNVSREINDKLSTVVDDILLEMQEKLDIVYGDVEPITEYALTEKVKDLSWLLTDILYKQR